MKNLIIRNIPEDLHSELKIRAIREKLTLGQLAVKALYTYINTLKGRDER